MSRIIKLQTGGKIFDVILDSDKEEGVLASKIKSKFGDRVQLGGFYETRSNPYSPNIDKRNLSAEQQQNLSNAQRTTSKRSTGASKLNLDLVKGRELLSNVIQEGLSEKTLTDAGFTLFTDPTNSAYKIVGYASETGTGKSQPYAIGRVKIPEVIIKGFKNILPAKGVESLKKQIVDGLPTFTISTDYSKDGTKSATKDITYNFISGFNKDGAPVINKTAIEQFEKQSGYMPENIVNSLKPILTRLKNESSPDEVKQLISQLNNVVNIENVAKDNKGAGFGRDASYRTDLAVETIIDGKNYLINELLQIIDPKTGVSTGKSVKELMIGNDRLLEIQNKFKQIEKMSKGGYLKKYLPKFQEGGAAPAPQVEPQTQTNPLEEIMSMAQEAVTNNDGELALQVCQQLVDIMAQAPTEKPTAPAVSTETPVFKKGGFLSKIKDKKEIEDKKGGKNMKIKVSVKKK